MEKSHAKVASRRLLFWLAATAAADVDSGPEVGDKAPALKVLAVTGEHEGKEVDYAADRDDKPTIYVFVQGNIGSGRWRGF